MYSGDIIRPVPRPGSTPADEAGVFGVASILPGPDDGQSDPVIAPSPEAETRVDGIGMDDAGPEETLETNVLAEETPRDGGSDAAALPRPDLAGGPVFFRPMLRPRSGGATRSETDLIAANALVTSLRPKPRPASLVIRATAAPLKPAVPSGLPKPTLVAKPVPVPQPVLKPRPVAKPVPPAAPVRPADVVMVGDSITAGGRWSSRFPDVTIVNRGISGDTGAKILARMDGILATKPKTALVMFGINDIYNGVPVERILQRYDQIISILEAQKIKVVIQSTLACSGHVCGEKLNQVYALNAGLVRIAKQRRLKYVDINKGLSDRSGLRRDFSRDGIHLNGEGYATWYAMLRPYIKS